MKHKKKKEEDLIDLKKEKILLTGIFLDEESIKRIRETLIKIKDIEKIPYENEVINMHCTLKYMPSGGEIANLSEIVGKPFTLKVIGYIEEEGKSIFQVELDPKLEKYYNNTYTENQNGIYRAHLAIPHIVASVDEIGNKEDDATYISIKLPEEKQFTVTGKAGYFIKGDPKKPGRISYAIVKSNADGFQGHKLIEK